MANDVFLGIMHSRVSDRLAHTLRCRLGCMRVTSYGAAGTVTGSCHLVEHDGYRLLLDCGAFQGKEEERNDDAFGFEPAQVDAVVLSHAHIDHIGRLPLLVARGYRGRVWATPATLAFLPILLEDALYLMNEDYQRAVRKGKKVEPPPWDETDLAALYDRLEPFELYQQRQFGPFQVRLDRAGHLPGSAFIEVEADGRSLVYSGDLGHRRKEVLPAPAYPPVANLVLCESTYGDRPHRPLAATLEELAQILAQSLEQGGKVFIPSFALERAQELLFYLREMEENRQIPRHPVYVDSPMASKITALYPQVYQDFGPEVQALYDRGIDPFRPSQLHFTRSVDDSKALNQLEGPAIVIAGSGMMSGGRILHHLRHGLSRAQNAVVIVGYQPRGGLGQQLIAGAREVRLFGEEVQVRASIHTLGGFSGHAGQDELLDWLTGEPRVALVHGEPDPIRQLQEKLLARGQQVDLMVWGKPLEV